VGSFAFQFHHCPHVNGYAWSELAKLQRFELLDRLFDLGYVTCLASGEIGGLKTAGVVLVFGLALFVGGFGASSCGRPKKQCAFFGELLNNLFYQSAFIHDF
jgi:hypothetical protein